MANASLASANLDEDLKTARDTIAAQEDELKEKMEIINSKIAENDALKNENATLKQQQQLLNQKLNDQAAQLKFFHDGKDKAIELIAQKNTEIDNLKAKLSLLEQKIKDKDGLLNNKNEEIASLKHAQNKLKNLYDELKEQNSNLDSAFIIIAANFEVLKIISSAQKSKIVNQDEEISLLRNMDENFFARKLVVFSFSGCHCWKKILSPLNIHE